MARTIDSVQFSLGRDTARAHPMHVASRPATLEDLSFLVSLRLRTIDPHIRAAGTQLTLVEHEARARSNLESCSIFVASGRPVGMMKVLRTPGLWNVDQFQIEPDLQRQGIGAQLMRTLQQEALQAKVRLALSVLKGNPALRLYERLGFKIVSETESIYAMESAA